MTGGLQIENSRLRLLGYKLLTQLLIWIGWLRDCVMPWGPRWEVRSDRVFYLSNQMYFSCCECGLAHLVWPLDGEEYKEIAFRFLPVRPFGYGYTMRHAAVPQPEDFQPSVEPKLNEAIQEWNLSCEPVPEAEGE